MANPDKNNQNWGLFAVLFTAIFTFLYGIFKTSKNIQARSQETDKASKLVRDGLQNGLTTDQITESFYDDASKQLGRSLTNSEKSKIKSIVEKEKEKFEKDGGALNPLHTDTNGNEFSIDDFDEYVKSVFIDIQKALQQVQPFLKFDILFQKAKESETANNLAELQVFIKNESYSTEEIWRVFANLEQKIGAITWSFSTAEPQSIQRKREEISKLNNFVNGFKNLLVTRGQILRHVRDMYNGKSKREETKKHETDELKTMTRLFQNDIDRITQQVDILNKVTENLRNMK